MTIRDEIIAIANQLANQGKKPTVALIKNKVSQAAPLPIIISTLRTWQHDPKNTELPTSSITEEQASASPNISLDHLEQHLAPLKAEIKEIRQLLNELTAAKGE